MRIFLLGTIVVIALCVMAVWVRPAEKAASNVLFGFAGIFTLMMTAAFFEWV